MDIDEVVIWFSWYQPKNVEHQLNGKFPLNFQWLKVWMTLHVRRWMSWVRTCTVSVQKYYLTNSDDNDFQVEIKRKKKIIQSDNIFAFCHSIKKFYGFLICFILLLILFIENYIEMNWGVIFSFFHSNEIFVTVDGSVERTTPTPLNFLMLSNSKRSFWWCCGHVRLHLAYNFVFGSDLETRKSKSNTGQK